MTADSSAGGLHGGVEEISNERQAAAAAGTGLRGRFHLPQRGQFLDLDSCTDRSLGDIIAGTDLCCIRQAGSPAEYCSASRLAHDQLMRFAWKGVPALGQRREDDVIVSITH